MAKAVKNNYSNIGEELDWLESKSKEIRKFIDSNPYHEVVDRDRVTQRTYSPDGDLVDEKYTLVATIETQHKSLRDAQKEYGQIIEMIDRLREKELAKMQTKGDAEISTLGAEFLKNR